MEQHGSLTQRANFAKVKQIAVLHVDLVSQCLELAVLNKLRERMELTTFTTTDMTRSAHLAHSLYSDRRNLHRDSRHWPTCSLLVLTFMRHVISHVKPAFFWLGFRGPDCNVIPKHGGGPDARPSWAGYGPRAGGCPPMVYIIRNKCFRDVLTGKLFRRHTPQQVVIADEMPGEERAKDRPVHETRNWTSLTRYRRDGCINIYNIQWAIQLPISLAKLTFVAYTINAWRSLYFPQLRCYYI